MLLTTMGLTIMSLGIDWSSWPRNFSLSTTDLSTIQLAKAGKRVVLQGVPDHVGITETRELSADAHQRRGVAAF